MKILVSETGYRRKTAAFEKVEMPAKSSTVFSFSQSTIRPTFCSFIDTR